MVMTLSLLASTNVNVNSGKYLADVGTVDVKNMECNNVVVVLYLYASMEICSSGT